MNSEKCEFFTDQINFCGHIVDRDGLHKTPEKVNAILNAPHPENVSQLQAFFGLVNYYGWFIKNLASKLQPLYRLLEANSIWKWSSECDAAFQRIKESITSEQVLTHYDPEKPVKLATDTSPYGLGAVLSHVFEDGSERPIAFASRSLNHAEKNYSQIDKEALGLVWGVKKFYPYLYGRHFTLVTDHQPLVSIFHPEKGFSATTAARLQRYALYLAGFQYDIEYKNTKKHGNADGLLCLPIKLALEEEDMLDTTHVYMMSQFECIPVSSKDVRNATAKDTVLSRVYDAVMRGWTDVQDKELIPFYNRRTELSVHQGCLTWGIRVIIPQRLRAKILEELHEGHLGICKMKSLA